MVGAPIGPGPPIKLNCTPENWFVTGVPVASPEKLMDIGAALTDEKQSIANAARELLIEHISHLLKK